MTTATEAAWTKLQRRYVRTTDREHEIRYELDARYFSYNYAPRGKRAKLEAARGQAENAWDAVWAFIEQHSPIANELGSGTPVWRIGRELTFAQIMNR